MKLKNSNYLKNVSRLFLSIIFRKINDRMKECIIYQVIGKINVYDRVSYTLNNFTYNTFLSSIAIYKYYTENDYKVSIILYMST